MTITVVANVYNNQSALEVFIKKMKPIQSAAPGRFEFVIVDDHSHDAIDLDVFDGLTDVRVYRVTEDVRWNMPGARNIGALEARRRCILFLDIDHIIPLDQVETLLSDAEGLAPGRRLTPIRHRASGSRAGEELKPNINCFLINRSDFFLAGGYEEDFAGHYGQEDKYFRYCCRRNGVEDQAAKFTLGLMSNSSTRGLDRDKARNEVILDVLVDRHIVRARRAFSYGYTQLL